VLLVNEMVSHYFIWYRPISVGNAVLAFASVDMGTCQYPLFKSTVQIEVAAPSLPITKGMGYSSISDMELSDTNSTQIYRSSRE